MIVMQTALFLRGRVIEFDSVQKIRQMIGVVEVYLVGEMQPISLFGTDALRFISAYQRYSKRPRL